MLTTFQFNTGDTAFSPGPTSDETIDEISGFVTGADRIDFLPPALGPGNDDEVGTDNYLEIDNTATTTEQALAEATLAANSTADTEQYVFVAGDTNGWLFVDSDPNQAGFEDAIRLAGLSTTGQFGAGDII